MSGTGFIVTWDVNSSDAGQCARLRRLIYGYALRRGDRPYRYPGFVDRPGVRYLGQSVLFVPPRLVGTLREALHFLQVEYTAVPAALW